MKFFYYLLILLSFGCSTNEKESENMSSKSFVSVEKSEALQIAYDDVFRDRNYSRARDTLDYYLSDLEYDSSLFDAYYALTFSYLNLLNFQKADSVNKLIDRTTLTSMEDLQWIENAFELSLHSGEYDQALKYNNEIYDHTGSKQPVWLDKYFFIYNKWLIFSLKEECDSAKGYLGAYIAALEKLDQVREWQGIDSTKMEYFENQYKSSCPLIDSVGLNLPTIIVHQ